MTSKGKPVEKNAELLISAPQIKKRVAGLASEIEAKLADRVTEEKPLVVVPILKGAFVFAADLVRQLSLPCRIEFARAKSYHGKDQGKVEHELPSVEFQGREVLVVDGIYDSGKTLKALSEELRGMGPSRVWICTLLKKKLARKTESVHVDFVGFEIEDFFIVGYGMDYKERGRHWPDIRIWAEENKGE